MNTCYTHKGTMTKTEKSERLLHWGAHVSPMNNMRIPTPCQN